MKVTLNIENDQELRAHIKDAIKGQVLAIVREEFVKMVKEELERKIKGADSRNFEYLYKQALKEAVGDILYKTEGVSNWNKKFIEPFANERLNAVISQYDWNKLVNDLAAAKVRALIK